MEFVTNYSQLDEFHKIVDGNVSMVELTENQKAQILATNGGEVDEIMVSPMGYVFIENEGEVYFIGRNDRENFYPRGTYTTL